MQNGKSISVRQFSLNHKTPVKGWLLLESGDGEYLIRQNSFFFRSFIPRKIYQSTVPINDHILKTPARKKNASFAWVFVGAPIGDLLYRNCASAFFGPGNDSLSIDVGIVNILFLWVAIAVGFMGTSCFRKFMLSRNIKKMGGEVLLIGKFVTKIPLGAGRYGLEGSNKIMVVIAYIALAVLFVPPSVILPFFVQLRLFALFVVGWFYLIGFNGNYRSDGKTAMYEIQLIQGENK